MAEPPEMCSNFARWYADCFMDEGATRDLRWKGVLNVARESTRLTAEVLVRLAIPTGAPAAGTKSEELGNTYQELVTAISGGDASFDPTRSARELQVLAAATLVQLFVRLPSAALAVSTASFGGLRRPELPMDLAGLAEHALRDLSARKHARTNKEELHAIAPETDFTVSPEALQSMDAMRWKGELERLRDAATAAVSAAVADQNRVSALLHRQILLDEEELQMLWWLTGGYSRHFDRAFSQIETEFRPLALAKELGEMTHIAPGPSSIGAMLSRAGVKNATFKLQDVVNAADLDWARDVSKSKRVSPVTTPLHFALEKRAELRSPDTWQAGWAGLTGLMPDAELPAIKFAELFYREYLILNVGA